MTRTPPTEKAALHASLNRQRDVVLWKIEGLDDDRLRRPMTPSGTNLIGLVQHLASVEYGWFCRTFGRESDEVAFDAADPVSQEPHLAAGWHRLEDLDNTDVRPRQLADLVLAHARRR